MADLNGIHFKHVGFKIDVGIGDIAVFMADIRNDIPADTKGKAELFFHSPETDEIFSYKRKFKMRAKNYEKISEDVSLPLSLAGRTYWSVCRAKLKSKYGKIKLEGISSPCYCQVPDKKNFVAEFRALVRDGVYFKKKIPIEVNARVQSRDLPKSVVCNIVESIDNESFRVIHSFKFKKQYSHSNFTWKVPKTYGTVKIFAEFIADDFPISPNNVKCQPLEYELRPYPRN